MGLDDLMPVVVVLGAALAAGIFNLVAKARPGRRGRPTRNRPSSGSSSA